MTKNLKSLKQRTLDANLMLPKHGLVTFTWGNASEIDRKAGIVAIKPSGISYETMTADDIVVVSLENGAVIDSALSPSSDTPTHLALYRAFPNIGGIVHTHSRWATIFAQAGRSILPFGTTHADYFRGEVPVTRKLTQSEIESGYEAETGKIIIECFEKLKLDPSAAPAALVHSHAPFVWGKDGADAAHNAVVLEEIAFMAWHNLMLDISIQPIQKELLDKHYSRKHGANAYYGQK